MIMGSEEQEYKDTLDAVERGDESAKTKLAWYMLSGSGGADVDAKGAVAILEDRVKKGDGEAVWMLGLCNEFGIGTDKDIERATKLYGQLRYSGNRIGLILLNKQKGRGFLEITRL